MYHRLPDNEAAAVVRRAIDLGVDYIDSAAGHDDGESERKIGLGIAGRRDGLHPATKTSHRDRDAAMADIERSLKLLDVDVIDCLQGLLKDRAEVALRGVLGLEGVSSALDEVDNLEQLEQNAAIARETEPLSDEEESDLLVAARELYEGRADDLWCIELPRD